MHIHRIALSAALAAGLAALPLASAEAQYYYPPCAFPLLWPFCIAGAIVNTAGMIVTAPFRAVAGPPYYSGYYARPYYPPPPPYYPPAGAYAAPPPGSIVPPPPR